jgi:hypothetical protein
MRSGPPRLAQVLDRHKEEIMTASFTPLIAAAALLGAAPAFASSPAGTYDDTTYPASPAIFANDVDTQPIVTPDVTYPGPHAAVLKSLRSASGDGALARHDDTVYPVAEVRMGQADGAESVAARPMPVRDAACGC